MNTRTFSPSRIQDYASCPMKYYWKHVRRLSTKTKAKGLSMGYCMSKGLEAYRAQGSFDVAAESFMNAWEEDGRVLRMEMDVSDPKDFRTTKRGLEILNEYVRENPDDPEQTVEPEVSFDGVEVGKVGDTTILLRGRIDGVMNIGGLCINEDKTAAALGPTYIPTLSESLQIKIYLWVADTLGLFRIGGKTSMPRCVMNVVKIHPHEYKHFRDITLKSRNTLEDARINVLKWAQQILWAEEHKVFPKNDPNNDIACNRYGGCEFKGICFSHGSVKDEMIKNEFIVREEKK